MPPDGPVVSTFWPGWTRPWSQALQRGLAGHGGYGRLFEGKVRLLCLRMRDVAASPGYHKAHRNRIRPGR
jgi:hypothetical protein